MAARHSDIIKPFLTDISPWDRTSPASVAIGKGTERALFFRRFVTVIVESVQLFERCQRWRRLMFLRIGRRLSAWQFIARARFGVALVLGCLGGASFTFGQSGWMAENLKIEFAAPSAPTMAAFDRHHRQCVIMTTTSDLRLVDLRTGNVRELHGGRAVPLSVAFSKDGRHVVIVKWKGTEPPVVQLYETATGRRRQLPEIVEPRFAFFLPGHDAVVVGTKRELITIAYQDGRWRVTSRKAWPFPVGWPVATPVVVSEVARAAFVGGLSPTGNGILVALDLGDPHSLVANVHSHFDGVAVEDLAVSSDGRCIAISVLDEVQVRDTVSLKLLRRFKYRSDASPTSRTTLSFANGDRWLISSAALPNDCGSRESKEKQKLLIAWDLATGVPLDTTDLPDAERICGDASLNVIAFMSQQTCHIVDITRKVLPPVPGPEHLLRVRGADIAVADVEHGGTTVSFGSALLPSKEEQQASWIGPYPRDEEMFLLSLVDDVTELSIASPVLTEAGLRFLGSHDRLRELDLTLVGSKSRGVSSSKWLKSLASAKRLRSLLLRSNTMTELQHIGALSHLETLGLELPNVPSDEFRHLAECSGLKTVMLEGCSLLDDSGTMFFESLKKLRVATLAGTKVGDRTVSALSHCTELRELDLYNTLVSDKAVAALCRLKQLERLDVRATSITQDGLRELRRCLPQCVIQPGAKE